MTRYEIEGLVPGRGVVKHVIKCDSLPKAVERFKGASGDVEVDITKVCDLGPLK